MTAQEFRDLALSLSEATEAEHMGHPDFRVRGKIFATLGPGEAWGMVKLTPEQQAVFVRTESSVFEPVKGAWGRRGATYVRLAAATAPSVRQALMAGCDTRVQSNVGPGANKPGRAPTRDLAGNLRSHQSAAHR
jgi:hypothetical protein